MTNRKKALLLLCASVAVVLLAVGLGSVYIPPLDILKILGAKLTGGTTSLPPITVGILWSMRLPRVLLAFLVGALLSMSGTVMQSVLKNPLASSYTLGVSAGAALAVALWVFFGLSASTLGLFTLPLVGLVGGVGTVVLAVRFAEQVDKQLANQTIVLVGMVFSLFINALLTMLSSLSRETLQKMVFWQMGSFSLKDWPYLWALFPIVLVGAFVLLLRGRELDNLTFGEDAAYVVGVDVKKVKWLLLFVSAGLTGCAVSLVGVIGFVDLVSPHMARRLFGSSHKWVLPMSALLGGMLMVLADVVARTVVSPSELPIGAVTAMLGAPFFIYLFFRKKR